MMKIGPPLTNSFENAGNKKSEREIPLEKFLLCLKYYIGLK